MHTVRVSLPLVMGSAVRAKLERRGIYEDHLEELVQETRHRCHVRKGRDGALLVFGRDRGGRYLLLVLFASTEYPDSHVVATCREMDDAEKRLYQAHTGE